MRFPLVYAAMCLFVLGIGVNIAEVAASGAKEKLQNAQSARTEQLCAIDPSFCD